MSMISELVKELRETAELFDKIDDGRRMLLQAANTIEALSAKLETANKELERWHTDKINDKIKNPFAWTSTLCCHNCDHKDEYIEELEAADMERPAEDCGGGWIYCGDGENLPEESGYYLVTYHEWSNGEFLPKFDDTYVKRLHYQKSEQFIGWNFSKCFDKRAEDDINREVLAWQPLPEPYHEP